MSRYSYQFKNRDLKLVDLRRIQDEMEGDLAVVQVETKEDVVFVYVLSKAMVAKKNQLQYDLSFDKTLAGDYVGYLIGRVFKGVPSTDELMRLYMAQIPEVKKDISHLKGLKWDKNKATTTSVTAWEL